MTGTEVAVDPELAALFDKVLADRRAARPSAGATLDLDRTLWGRLTELGLTRLAREADWPTLAELLRAAARHAAPVPLAEHDALAGWALAKAGIEADDQIRTLARLDSAGLDPAVPWASQADRIVGLWPANGSWFLADLAASELTIVAGRDLAGAPRDRVSIDPAALRAPVEISAEVATALGLRGALVRAVQASGAIERIVDLCVRHVTERHQFGRPLARFQAVQHLVADAAAEATLLTAATDAAVAVAAAYDSSNASLVKLERAVAVARSVLGVSSDVVVRNAHQVHGAIGTTLEHPLQELTRPVLAWRSDYGSVRHWDRRVAEIVALAGTDPWSALVGRIEHEGETR